MMRALCGEQMMGVVESCAVMWKHRWVPNSGQMVSEIRAIFVHNFHLAKLVYLLLKLDMALADLNKHLSGHACSSA